jgi:hypothetical protein
MLKIQHVCAVGIVSGHRQEGDPYHFLISSYQILGTVQVLGPPSCAEQVVKPLRYRIIAAHPLVVHL